MLSIREIGRLFAYLPARRLRWRAFRDRPPPVGRTPVRVTRGAFAMSDDDTIRKTGRGGLAVAGAKIYFIVLGLVQNLALKSALGVDGYGALSRVQTIASVTYNPI